MKNLPSKREVFFCRIFQGSKKKMGNLQKLIVKRFSKRHMKIVTPGRMIFMVTKVNVSS